LGLPATVDEIPGAKLNSGTWTVPLTPILNSENKIHFICDWDTYGTITSDLEIGGEDFNGTIASTTPKTFPIDNNVTIEVKVFDGLHQDLYSADVELYWILDNGQRGSLINSTNGPTEAGQNSYNFNFNTEDQRDQPDFLDIKAPRKILVHSYVTNLGHGYDVIEMKPQNDLIAHISKDTVLAGERTEITFSVNTTSGEEPDNTNLQFEIYNDTGKKVTLDNTFGSVVDGDLTDIENDINEYFLIPGIYTIYVHNDTHDSTGHNTTLIVESAKVNPSLTELIWKVDENVSIVFTITDGLDGKLKLYNITDVGTYNKAWVNESGPGNNTITLNVVNGTCTLDNVSALFLDTDESIQYITFEFKSNVSGSAYAEASGSIAVTIPSIEVSPSMVSYNKASEIEITVLGRGQPLIDVNVSIKVPGLEGKINSTTNNEGKVFYNILPSITGFIEIYVDGRLSSTKIEITSLELYIDAPDIISEGEDFVLTVRKNTATGEQVNGVTITFGEIIIVIDGTTTLTAPLVSSDRSFEIIAEKDGYGKTIEEIFIVNKPKLVVIVNNNEFGFNKDISIIVADEKGASVIGATIHFGESTFLTGANGEVKLKTPEQESQFELYATMDGYTDSEKTTIYIKKDINGSPGFEVLGLVIALGIAFILYRRKTK